MEIFKVGAIGCGYWGPNLILNNVENTSSDVVIAVDLKKRTTF